MNAIRFTKMHGIGNDFIVIDGVTTPAPNDDLRKLAIAINDRRAGVGGDGLILIVRDPDGVLRMRMLNPDGSEAEMCGNGVRCAAKLVRERKIANENPIAMRTGNGLLSLETGSRTGNGTVDWVKVDMGVARLERGQIPMTGPAAEKAIRFALNAAGQTFEAAAVSMGNPHCVIFVENVDAVPLEVWGPGIENAPEFPNRVNAQFAQIVSRTEIKMRTWERGAGATLACGTGACAVAVAAFENGLTEREVTTHLPGGDLKIEYREDGRVLMTGPAVTVFEGVWPA